MTSTRLLADGRANGEAPRFPTVGADFNGVDFRFTRHGQSVDQVCVSNRPTI